MRNADGTYSSPPGYFDTLVVAKDEAGAMIGATITDKHGTVSTYGADGWVTQITDRNGNTMRFEYENVLGSTFGNRHGGSRHYLQLKKTQTEENKIK